MKKVLISLFAVAAMVSCSNDELVELNQEAIDFSNAFIENTTKADDLSYSGTTPLEAFKVYGAVKGSAANYVTIFSDDAVTGTVGENVWSCANKQYWIKDASYAFGAVTNGTVATVGTDATKNSFGLPATITYDADETGTNDLLFAEATATGKATGNEPVDFTFNHLLAQAWFTVTSNTEGGYEYTVSNIQITNLYQTGTYTTDGIYGDGVDNGTWAGTGTKSATDFGAIESVSAANTSGKTNATKMLLIPTQDAYTVSFDVTLSKNSAVIDTYHKNIEVTTDLVKGNSYNFTIALSVGEQIQFTVTSQPTWKSTTDVTVM